MGLASWMLAGILAWALARWLPGGGSRGRWRELVRAVTAAIMAGIIATVLDFGGWRELDSRAVSFSFAVSLFAVAIPRRRREKLRSD